MLRIWETSVTSYSCTHSFSSTSSRAAGIRTRLDALARFLDSAIPLMCWVGDVFYRSNLRNMDPLREHLDKDVRFQPTSSVL
ncbi:hypothetical protein FHR70_004820 [Microvirga lupini]|uniref:Uncharacterized protein n=1 Tax=Microvirga lupini TaxID=420324 RepID=A0A7W4VR04_9HYPH|nr:hypothetical protein [Microvirga lupini]